VQNNRDNKLLKKLGERIRQFRKSKNMTQVELAVACDNYAEQIGRIERGELNVSISTLKMIAKALNVKFPVLVDVD
jgi:transcriptional regulator with XRE-family HTH domain